MTSTTNFFQVDCHSIAVGSCFDDYDSFRKMLSAYQKQTNQLFVIKKSKSVDAVNKKLDSKSVKYNDALKWSYLYYSAKMVEKQRRRPMASLDQIKGNIKFFSIQMFNEILIQINYTRYNIRIP